MPPKVKVQKQEILTAALEIVRSQGADALNARTLAGALHCSTQPIFSNFPSMEALRQAVLDAADARFQDCLHREMEAGEFPPYKASGMAYIRFAQEERDRAPFLS